MSNDNTVAGTLPAFTRWCLKNEISNKLIHGHKCYHYNDYCRTVIINLMFTQQ